MSYTSPAGSPLFPSKWRGKCPECKEVWLAGDPIGFVAGHDKPLCQDCHRDLDTFVPDPHYYH